MRRCIILLALVTYQITSVRAQDSPPAPDGAIEEAQVIIEKNREITLPFANRYFEKINVEHNRQSTESLQYDFAARSFDPGSIEVAFTPQVYQSSTRALSSQSLIKLGYGNYASPLLQASVFTDTHSSWLLGVDLDHLSFGSGEIDEENSAGGSSALRLTGSKLAENGTFNATLGYNTRNGYFYGYPDETIINDRDSIRQVFNEFQLRLDWTGKLAEDGKLFITTEANLINDEYGVSENKFGAAVGADIPLTEVLDLNLGLYGTFSSLTNGLGEYKRNLYRASPGVTYAKDALKLKVGAQLVMLDEDSTLNEDFTIYPDVRLDYGLSQVVNVYLGVGGGMRQHYFESRARQNFFISDSARLQHASEQWQGFIGIAASSQKLTFDINARYGQISNLGYFVNQATNPAKFDLIYDTGTTGLLTLSTTTGYVINERLGAELGATFYSYSTDSLAAAYQVPELEAFVNIAARLADRWSLSTKGQFISGLVGFEARGMTTVDLDAFFDLSVELNYAIDDHWGAFIMADNVLSQDYSRYWRYPNRQFMAKLGVAYSF